MAAEWIEKSRLFIRSKRASARPREASPEALCFSSTAKGRARASHIETVTEMSLLLSTPYSARFDLVEGIEHLVVIAAIADADSVDLTLIGVEQRQNSGLSPPPVRTT